jgi:hypothetical protein
MPLPIKSKSDLESVCTLVILMLPRALEERHIYLVLYDEIMEALNCSKLKEFDPDGKHQKFLETSKDELDQKYKIKDQRDGPKRVWRKDGSSYMNFNTI